MALITSDRGFVNRRYGPRCRLLPTGLGPQEVRARLHRSDAGFQTGQHPPWHRSREVRRTLVVKLALPSRVVSLPSRVCFTAFP